jgi:2-polyprenyl-6-methoxyphenol hydroxylase-like FAD-dependent oxidoreductase
MREMVEGVAVIGGGVAGFTLAAALRARGLPVELAGVRGAGPDRHLHLWPGALAALDRIGLLGPVVRHGTALERLRLSSSSGHTLIDLDARQLSGGGIGCLTIRASAFIEVLQGACAGVPIRLDRRVIGYAEDELGVLFTFEGGWPLRAPVAVGADGVRSRVRLQCLDDGAPMYSGDSVWEGIGPRPASYAHAPAALDLIWGADGVRAGMVPIDLGLGLGLGLDGGQVAWWVDVATGIGGGREPGPGKPRLAETIDTMGGTMGGAIRDVVAATPEAAIRRTDVYCRRRQRSAGRGHVTLIGDAAHPMPITLRMGASLAIEDAVALADALAAEPDPQRALRRFEEARAPRIAHAQRLLWRLRRLEVRQSLTASRVRDSLIAQLSLPTVAGFLTGLTFPRHDAGMTGHEPTDTGHFDAAHAGA